jgi:hypothetical protein
MHAMLSGMHARGVEGVGQDGRMTIEPDTKDWTWVLQEPCPECGYDASEVDRSALATMVRETAQRWSAVLERPEAGVRPAPHIWSPLEYACHVRDVHRVFRGRVGQMLDQDDPTFANWDQDATAVELDYPSAEAATVARELTEAAADMAAAYDSVEEEQWDRPALRSDGSRFTVESLGRYHLHDVFHHLHDVSG